MNFIRKNLAAKLFLSYMAVVSIGVATLIIASRLSVPVAYNRHMLGMPGMNGGFGPGPGGGMMGDLYHNFRSSFNEALAYAGLAAIATAVLVSAYFSNRIVAPIKKLMSASQRISKGHYDERVKVTGTDELGQLGERFNLMTAELEQTENRRRQLIGDVSHELRTPLTGIMASMEGLVDGILPATSEVFLQIQKEADRLSRLVDDLQELSRVESGAYQLQIRPVAISSLVSTTVKRLNPEITRKRILLTINLPNDLPPVLVDEDRITQVFTNLVNNAINFTPEDGKIQISGKKESNFVRISILDTGIGISSEQLPFIFDRFYRADKSRSREHGGGSGIGLTVTRSLVEAHGGSVYAKSAGAGQGSTFSFTLPIAT
jgi:two-component system, OmpR family, sensor histidine kinase BaeS